MTLIELFSTVVCVAPAAGLNLGLRPANERGRHKVTPFLICFAQTLNQPCSSPTETNYMQNVIFVMISLLIIDMMWL